MVFLKFLEKSFGSLLILLALTIIFTGLSVKYSIENINVMTESAEEKIPGILQANKDILVKALEEKKKIDKTELKKACKENPEELSEDFCKRIDTMTEEEAKNEFTDIMIVKVQEELKPELQEFEQDIKSNLEELRTLKYLVYAMPLGIIIFLLGSLLIFLAEKFNWKTALSYISIKTGIISGFSVLTNYFVKNLTPERFENLIKNLPIIRGEEGGVFAIKLMSAIMVDWLKVVSYKMFLISIIAMAASFLTTVFLFVLKRKLAKKKPEEKSKKEEKVKKKKVTKIKK